MEYKFRKFEKSDYDFVYKVKKDAYQKYIEQYFGAWDEELQQKFFKDYIDKQKDSIKIIVVEDSHVGFFDASVINKNVFEIANICIVSQFQGKGLGTKILKEAILNCTQKEIDIQCFLSNPVKSLYERLGFVEYEKTKTHVKMRLKKE